MDEAGWTDKVMDEAERLLPILVDAGYAATDDAEWTWRFRPARKRSRTGSPTSGGQRRRDRSSNRYTGYAAVAERST
jgi:hypothetical protein